MDRHPEFPLEICHLNHAGVGPLPRRSVEAVTRFAEENLHLGSKHYPRWLEVETSLRERLARLINARSADDIALVKSTSEGLSIVAYGIDWNPGDNIVVGRQEFPSNRIVWESLQARFGVRVTLVDLFGDATPEDALLRHVDGDTRLLAVSSVQYASGWRMDLNRLGSRCQDAGALFCVDAIQSLGALPFDARAVEADFVVADGHKWMLGPEGLGVFYATPEQRERLRLNQFGWHMVKDRGDFDRLDWQPAPDARRFECGSPNLLGIQTFEASLSLLEETGLSAVASRVTHNSNWLIEHLGSLGMDIITPQRPDRQAGIVTFTPPGKDAAGLYRNLLERDVLCAHRGGGVRFSPHFYTPESDLVYALECIEEWISHH